MPKSLVFKITTTLTAILLFGYSESVFSSDSEVDATHSVIHAEEPLPSKNQAIYFLVDAGWSRPGYLGLSTIASAINSFRGGNEYSNNFALNLGFGVYLPLQNQKTLVGLSFNGTADRYTYHADQDSKVTSAEYIAKYNNHVLQLNHYFLGPSLIHFFGQNVGHGFFLRVDLGTALFVPIFDAVYSYRNFENSTLGLGALGGAGYALPVSQGLRLLFSGNLAVKTANFGYAVDSLRTVTLNLNTSVLF